jgi:hypothetical protein
MSNAKILLNLNLYFAKINIFLMLIENNRFRATTRMIERRFNILKKLSNVSSRVKTPTPGISAVEIINLVSNELL